MVGSEPNLLSRQTFPTLRGGGGGRQFCQICNVAFWKVENCPRIGATVLPRKKRCSRIAHVLLTYCSRIAHVLLTYCSRIAHVLLTYCSRTQFCSRIAHVLLTYCSRIAHVLPAHYFTYCSRIAHVLLTYCSRIAHVFCARPKVGDVEPVPHRAFQTFPGDPQTKGCNLGGCETLPCLAGVEFAKKPQTNLKSWNLEVTFKIVRQASLGFEKQTEVALLPSARR